MVYLEETERHLKPVDDFRVHAPTALLGCSLYPIPHPVWKAKHELVLLIAWIGMFRHGFDLAMERDVDVMMSSRYHVEAAEHKESVLKK
ncbi:hypothetical protein [Celeribacter sp.]|uniref:hypothetical protein n=1 Tax=Celeribacter sp. TaxID=1890673 RepID=UPI003A935D1E